MSEVSIQVEKRDTRGKGASKTLRRNGRIPGVYYFHGEESVALSVDHKDLRGLLHSDANVIDLGFSASKKAKCVIREVQWDPVASEPLHVDFMGIKLSERITVTVPVHLVGESAGVKLGGILQHILREISVECLPLDIPEHLEVDISDLDVGDGITVADLSIEKVKVLNEPTQSIVIVRPPAVVEEPTADEELAEGEEVAEDGDEEDAESSTE